MWACPRSRGGTRPPSRQHKFARQDPAAAGPRQSSPGTALPTAFPRKTSPGTAPPPAFPRKNSPSTPQTAVFGPFFVRWANFVALASTIRPSRAKNVAHWARKHERLERKIAPARGVKGRRETFFAHARSQEPFLTHFNRAEAMFLSLRMHARHWSNPLGRYFFQDQTKTTDRASDPDAPNQTPATRPHWCGGRRRDRRAWPRCRWAAAGPGRASRQRVQPPISITSPTGVEGAGGTGGPGRGARGRRRGLAGLRDDAPSL